MEGFFGDEAIAAGADTGVEEIIVKDLGGGGVGGGAVFGDESASDDGVGPAPGGFADVAGTTVMEDVIDIRTGNDLCGGGVEEMSEADGAVDEVTGLFVRPPVFSMTDGGRRNFSGIHAGVVGIGEIFGVAGEAGELTFEPAFDPAARFDRAEGKLGEAAVIIDFEFTGRSEADGGLGGGGKGLCAGFRCEPKPRANGRGGGQKITAGYFHRLIPEMNRVFGIIPPIEIGSSFA